MVTSASRAISAIERGSVAEMNTAVITRAWPSERSMGRIVGEPVLSFTYRTLTYELRTFGVRLPQRWCRRSLGE